MCRGDDAICVLTGDAGTGKSLACKAARRAFELEGFRCIGATIAKKAALGLQESTGIASTSVAKLIGSEELDFRGDLELSALDEVRHHAAEVARAGAKSFKQDLKRTPLGRFLVSKTPLGTVLDRTLPHERSPTVTVDERTVLFVDEAAQLSTRDMEKLIRLVRERGGKICLVGDAKQHQPIAAGQPFAAAARMLGEARLTQIIRQKDEVDREVSRAFSRGAAAQAFQSLLERGRLHMEKSTEVAMHKMVADWANAGGVRNGKSQLLLCSTNAERAELNRLAQLEMKKARRLGKNSVTVNGESFHQGDRIAFTRNAAFYEVSNGDLGTIQRIGRKRITWKTFRGKQFSSLASMLKYAEKVHADPALWITVKLDSGKVVDIPLERYQDFRLGYCLNSYQAQGCTVQSTRCLLNPTALSRESIYVAASRARDDTTLYTAGIAIDELISKASKSRAKRMAHDLLPPHHEHVRSRS
jgi:ATP-dependent exoDNAse (exonuclease V) alpha subunit